VIRIGSNIFSLNAQRRLADTTNLLSDTFERLSSGQRINKASDDAAGLSIASSLNADHRVYGQAIRNLNDGLSYLNIASGAIQELKSILIRQRELSTQSSNGVYSDSQRSALNTEVQELLEEYNRIQDVAEFNGLKIFSGDRGGLVLQGGYGDDETLRLLERDSTIVGAQEGGGGETSFSIICVSVDSAGNPANEGGASRDSALSADGRYVTFSSSATNLVPGDVEWRDDIFLRDTQTGTTTRVSVDSGGAAGNNNSSNPSISADGRYITFESTASNLVVGDTNNRSDIFLHDTQTGITTRVSVDSGGSEANHDSYTPSISADGRYITFESAASNLVVGDTNNRRDIFLHDTQTGTTTRLSVDSGGSEANHDSYIPSISANGRYVTYTSSASNLVVGDTNGYQDVFVHDTQSGTTTRVSVHSSGTEGDTHSGSSSISADGRYVVFYSAATTLIDGDTNAAWDVFLHDTQTGNTTRVSMDSEGNAGNSTSSHPAISGDGRYVAFASFANNLVTGDTNARQDIFVHDIQTGTTTRVSVAADGTQANTDCAQPAISSDGQYVAFETFATTLIPGDLGLANVDVFRATNITNMGGGSGGQSTTESLPLLSRLADINVATRSNALSAQGTIDNYMGELDTASGEIGVAMARIEISMNNLAQRADNIKAAEGRIMDADIAQETAQLVRTQILQQAGAMVLSQANQQPALAIQLLRT
jgi:flagellin-like hook-associated protein FlgL